jgi:hypothetical protein
VIINTSFAESHYTVTHFPTMDNFMILKTTNVMVNASNAFQIGEVMTYECICSNSFENEFL